MHFLQFSQVFSRHFLAFEKLLSVHNFFVNNLHLLLVLCHFYLLLLDISGPLGIVFVLADLRRVIRSYSNV